MPGCGALAHDAQRKAERRPLPSAVVEARAGLAPERKQMMRDVTPKPDSGNPAYWTRLPWHRTDGARREVLREEAPQRLARCLTCEQKVVVMATGQLQKLFRPLDGSKQPLAVAKRHDLVLAAVGDEHRARDAPEGLQRVVAVAREPPRRQPRIELRRQLRHRDEARG